MKPSLSVLVVILASLTLGLAQEPLAQLRLRGGTLLWQGGFPPYDIQSSADLFAWKDEAKARASWFVPTDSSPKRFFRVRGSASAPWGKALGQWRVMEGEFGLPLAKHRLKSLWDWFEPLGGPAKDTPANYFRSLVVRLAFLDGSDIITHGGPLESLPAGSVEANGQILNVAWNFGEGFPQRSYSLRMEFPYPVDKPRTKSPLLSDASVRLRCSYGTPQPEFSQEGEAKATLQDECDLVEVVEKPDGFWLPQDRPIKVSGGNSQRIEALPTIGNFLREGNPVFILKTPILVQWKKPTVVTGLTIEPFTMSSRFSQTYAPFHHNFVETLYLEPALEPGISPSILAELRARDIRFIRPMQPTAFPEQPASLEVIGFDGKVRKL